MFKILLEEFHKKLNKLQQLEDELKNNVRKWHWAGHVQKTIISQVSCCRNNKDVDKQVVKKSKKCENCRTYSTKFHDARFRR